MYGHTTASNRLFARFSPFVVEILSDRKLFVHKNTKRSTYFPSSEIQANQGWVWFYGYMITWNWWVRLVGGGWYLESNGSIWLLAPCSCDILRSCGMVIWNQNPILCFTFSPFCAVLPDLEHSLFIGARWHQQSSQVRCSQSSWSS